MAIAGRTVRGAVARPMPGALPVKRAQAAPLPRLRRCAFRRVTVMPGRGLAMYEADCMHPDLSTATSLGDLVAAQPVCAACTLPGVFRPDSD